MVSQGFLIDLFTNTLFALNKCHYLGIICQNKILAFALEMQLISFLMVAKIYKLSSQYVPLSACLKFYQVLFQQSQLSICMDL